MKPSNVILQPDGKLKLVDFGTVKRIVGQHSDTVALGTIPYASPEQFSGQDTPRSDIYALGMTLHYLLTGIKPGRGEYFPVKHWRPDIPDDLNAIINKCVQQNPDNRYQSCQELLYDLDHQNYFSNSIRNRNIFSFLKLFKKKPATAFKQSKNNHIQAEAHTSFLRGTGYPVPLSL